MKIQLKEIMPKIHDKMIQAFIKGAVLKDSSFVYVNQ